jgi:hypothetical protein
MMRQMMAQTGGPMGPGMHGPGAMHGTQVTEDEAKALAQKYVDEQLKGFTIEKVVPSTGMPRTMYTVELKGPKGESKTLQRDAVPCASAPGITRRVGLEARHGGAAPPLCGGRRPPSCCVRSLS